MVSCPSCGSPASSSLVYCGKCIRERGEFDVSVRERRRLSLGLPKAPPTSGVKCSNCSNECRIPEGGVGYCGIWRNERGRLVPYQGEGKGLLYHYLDPHVTNCCAAWFCPGGTGMGYPKYAYVDGPEIGYYNLAIFFYGCNFDCLFCQNHEHKSLEMGHIYTPDELAAAGISPRISCWCFFGGSPEPQLQFAIKAARRALEHRSRTPNKILRICWEWNGCGNRNLALKAAELSYESGGTVKFDLKAWSPELSMALSGVPNKRAYENFEAIARKYPIEEDRPPTITATTLLVPFYVDEYEVSKIAEFIASIDERIPYSLLVFHPDHLMRDLPITPREQVLRCYRAAKRHLKRVNIGNLHLIGGL